MKRVFLILSLLDNTSLNQLIKHHFKETKRIIKQNQEPY